jgi:hypothetical protein
MQCLATFRLSTSPLHRHCYSSQQDELRARPVCTRIAGQRARPACAPALQPGQRAHRPCRHSGAWVRECARTHPGGARASCVPQLRAPAVGLPCPPPRPPSHHSFGQLAKNLPPTVQPTNFGLFFRSPQNLGVCGEQYLSDPWAPGHAALCVWKPERRSFTHSKSHARLLSIRFFRSQSERSPYMWEVGLTQQIA